MEGMEGDRQTDGRTDRERETPPTPPPQKKKKKIYIYRGFPTRIVHLHYISRLRDTILAGNLRERERERERDVYVYIYVCVCVCGERDTHRQTDRQR